jgi:hypothetical protein
MSFRGRTSGRLTYSNVVATVALFVALGGTTYAVTKLPKNSVKSKQIASNAVRSDEIAAGAVGASEVADGSLLSGDFAAGQLPAGKDGPQGIPGPTFAAFDDETQSDPVPNPDGNLLNENITTPAAGRLLVFFTATEALGADGVTVNCSAGNPTLGLYVDGTPVPDTKMNLDTAVPEQQAQFGVTAAAIPAGVHENAVKNDCASGTVGSTVTSNSRSLGAVLLGG